VPVFKAAPLTRRSIARAALALVDEDGYEAFSMPRLAERLGVRTPSLYHHFDDRAGLMAEIARTVVRDTPVPDVADDAPWTEFFVLLALNFRATILAHPSAAPLLLQFLPREVLVRSHEAAAERLRSCPIPLEDHVLLLDGLEKLTLGSALTEAVGDRSQSGDNPFPMEDPALTPQLARAVDAHSLDRAELFVATIRAFLDGVAHRH
jgi:TetR/AcrR family transcriptional regulator, tetracycline repressor protein